jgi:hypothetical protein
VYGSVRGDRRIYAQPNTCTAAAAQLVAALAAQAGVKRGTWQPLFPIAEERRAALTASIDACAEQLLAVRGSGAAAAADGAHSRAGGALPTLLGRQVDKNHPARRSAPYDYGLYTETPIPPYGVFGDYRCAPVLPACVTWDSAAAAPRALRCSAACCALARALTRARALLPVWRARAAVLAAER